MCPRPLLVALGCLVVAACFHKPPSPNETDDARPGDGSIDSPLGPSKTTVRALTAGDHHACAISSDGAVLCWGDNREGQLGAVMPSTGRPVAVPAAAGAIEIAAGRAHTCALLDQQRGVLCWGANGLLQTGRSGPTSLGPVQVPFSGTAFVPAHIFAGGDASCATDNGGTAQCWGAIDDPASGAAPSVVSPGRNSSSNWAGFALSSEQSCALLLDATGSTRAPWCWGESSKGQAGIVRSMRIPLANANKVNVDLTSLRVASGVTIGIDATGHVVGWGDIAFDGRQTESDPKSIGTATADVLAVGRNHACTIAASVLQCWGRDDFGATGAFVPTPVGAANRITDGVALVAGGLGFTCFATGATAGAFQAYCIGANQWGELGFGDVTSQHTPLKVNVAVTASSALAAGWGHTCVTTPGSGTGLTCWGDDTSGQVSGTPGTVGALPRALTINGLISPEIVVAGAQHTCALGSDGVLHCAGNAAAYAGFDGGSDVSSFAAADNTTCVVPIESDAHTTCAGDDMGVVGSGTVGPVLTAIAIGTDHAAGFGPAAGSGAQPVAYGWGDDCGNLRGNSAPDVLPINPGTLVVAQGTYSEPGNICLQKFTGAVSCWGPADHGVDGPGSDACALAPGRAITFAGGAFKPNARPVVSGHHACALDNGPGNNLVCWGDNTDGSFGLPGVPEADDQVPTDGIGATLTFSIIAGGPHHTCGITAVASSETPELYCWGLNRFGEVGNGKRAHLEPVPVQFPD